MPAPFQRTPQTGRLAFYGHIQLFAQFFRNQAIRIGIARISVFFSQVIEIVIKALPHAPIRIMLAFNTQYF